MYVPTTAEIPREYLAPLAQRARDAIGDAARTTHATRGHLIRQAVLDGLLRGYDHLIGDDGSVDIVCDPHHEMALEIDDRQLTLNDLLAAMTSKHSIANPESAEVHVPELDLSAHPKEIRKAA